MLEKEIVITNTLGLHVRAATKLVQTASLFDIDVSITCNGQTADAKSIMEVLMLAAIFGTTVTLRDSGENEEEEGKAISQISTLFENRFDEE